MGTTRRTPFLTNPLFLEKEEEEEDVSPPVARKSKPAGVKGIKDYGVGSCGPRGFYGTFDAHINLEEEIAKFLGVDEAILYR